MSFSGGKLSSVGLCTAQLHQKDDVIKKYCDEKNQLIRELMEMSVSEEDSLAVSLPYTFSLLFFFSFFFKNNSEEHLLFRINVLQVTHLTTFKKPKIQNKLNYTSQKIYLK